MRCKLRPRQERRGWQQGCGYEMGSQHKTDEDIYSHAAPMSWHIASLGVPTNEQKETDWDLQCNILRT